jgi:methionyl-tRNA formyltransferase
MRVIILTSSFKGTAAHHLPYLIESGACQISMVVLNENTRTYSIKSLKRVVRKILKIGWLGALNGIRMRKWYGENSAKYAHVDNIEHICKKNGIPLKVTPVINCETTINLFQEANAELGISLGNGYIAEYIFKIPKYGMINIHHEILPDYQNAQSIIWQIYNLSSRTGFTIHRINKQIDKGDVIYQEGIPIVFSNTLADTVAKTSAQLLKESAKGLIYTLLHFEDLLLKVNIQEKGKRYTTPTFWQYLRMERNFRKLKYN